MVQCLKRAGAVLIGKQNLQEFAYGGTSASSHFGAVHNPWNPDYVAGFNALNKWANEYLPFPGEFFRHWVKDFYQQNQLIKGQLMMAGRRVDLREFFLETRTIEWLILLNF